MNDSHAGNKKNQFAACIHMRLFFVVVFRHFRFLVFFYVIIFIFFSSLLHKLFFLIVGECKGGFFLTGHIVRVCVYVVFLMFVYYCCILCIKFSPLLQITIITTKSISILEKCSLFFFFFLFSN